MLYSVSWRRILRRKGIYRRFSKCDWDEAYEANKHHANTQRRLAELLRADVWGAIRVADTAINRQCSSTKKLGLCLSLSVVTQTVVTLSLRLMPSR